jgi:CMP/dCMP kinase
LCQHPIVMKDIVIAIDGHSGCGKSTTAKRVAEALHYTYLDSGAMYRAVTYYFIQHNINLEDAQAIQNALTNILIEFRYNQGTKTNETYLNGINVERDIRNMEVSERVSRVSAIPSVRSAMVAQQRKLGTSKRVVMDGRDIGTHVFPDAELKIFMTADLLTRARRRKEELKEKGQDVSLEEITRNLSERDHIDTTRKENPLLKADTAIEIDTTHITIEEQVEKVINLARELIEKD